MKCVILGQSNRPTSAPPWCSPSPGPMGPMHDPKFHDRFGSRTEARSQTRPSPVSTSPGQPPLRGAKGWARGGGARWRWRVSVPPPRDAFARFSDWGGLPPPRPPPPHSGGMVPSPAWLSETALLAPHGSAKLHTGGPSRHEGGRVAPARISPRIARQGSLTGWL